MDHDDIAGYSLRRKLGSGSAGTVWQVRDLASGRNAVLKRIPTTAITDQEKLREDLAVLQRVRHPHLARLLEFRETGTEWLLISQYVVAGSLSALLTRRGPLSTGELVTLLIPLAEALDHVHRSGLTHGALTPSNILFDADGRPVLTDTALHNDRSADDWLALASLAQEAGGDPAVFTPDLFTATQPEDLPGRLLALAAPAPIDLAFPQGSPTTPTDQSTSQPRRRPTTKPTTTDDPIELSRSPLSPPPPAPTSTAQAPAASRPDLLPPAKPRPKRTRPRPWRRSQTLWGRLRRSRRIPWRPAGRLHPAYGVLAAAALGAVVVLAVGIATIGVLDSPATPAAPAAAAARQTPQPTARAKEEATWAQTLRSLDARRAEAFWTLDLEALDKIYVPGSTPWLADRALLSSYRREGVRVQGLRIQIESTTVTHRTDTTVTLKTTDHLTAGQAVDHSGTRTPLPPGVPTTRLITLTTSPAASLWRIATITPV